MAKAKTKISLKIIDTEIATFVQSRDALRNHAQNIVMMIMLHAAPAAVNPDCNGTGDVSRFIKLGRALPSSWASQVMEYIQDYTPVQLRLRDNGDDVGLNAEYRKLSAERKHKDTTAERKLEIDEERNAMWNLEGMNAVPFWEHNAEPKPVNPKTFDDLLQQSTLGRAKALRKSIDDGKVLEADIASVQALAAALESVKVTRVEVKNDNSNDDEIDQPAKNVG